MANTTTRNLAERTIDGLTVSLDWYPRRRKDTCTVTVADDHDGQTYFARVPDDKALDAFNHPFAYVDVTSGKTHATPATSGTLGH